MKLQEFALWILSGGGAGVIAYALIAAVPFLSSLAADYKRYASLALTAVIAALIWLGTIWMGWTAQPTNPQAWVESVFSVVATALITAQTIHGARDLRQRRINGE